MLIRRGVRDARRCRQLLAVVAIVAVVVSLVQALSLVSARSSSRALASAASGTGGQFVPLQGRLLDTRAATSIGPYSTPMPAGAWRKVPVEGVAGLPTSGVSAVTVTFTVLLPASSGLLHADKDETTPNSTVTYMNYAAGNSQSNTGTLAVAADGKIQVYSSASVDLVIEVQGYYTADDDVAPGGYVPVTPTRLVDTRNGTGLAKAALAGGSTSLIQVSGHAGVPAGASAVMVNITIINDTATGDHTFVPYPADEARPAISDHFNPGVGDSNGTQVGLDTTDSYAGAFKLYLSASGYTIDMVVDVVGYFTAGQSTGAFTPATARVVDTRTAGHTPVASGAVKSVQVTGVSGIPLAGSGISAVVTNLEVIDHSGTEGYLEMYASGITRPSPYSSIHYAGDGVTSNMTTSALGTNGAVNVWNSGPDAADFVVDVEGWYTNTGAAISNGQTSTQQSVTLQAEPTGGGSWVTYKYRTGNTATFTNVPVTNAADGNGNHPSAWPVQKSSGAFTAYTWNIRDTLAALTANHGIAPDSLVQLQACFGTSATDANPVCGMPTEIDFAQSDFDGATQNEGPGTLAEITGDFEVDATDAAASSSLGGLSVGRTLTTLAPANQSGAAGVFGPGWTTDLDSSAGEAGLTPVDHAADGYLLFTDTDGVESTYQATSSVTSYPITFTGSGDNAGDGEAVTKVDSTHITMTDPDGTVTTWTKTSSGWQASSVVAPGSNSTTGYTYNSSGLVTRILAPVPTGVTSCSTPDTTPGCRSLVLTYGTGTLASRLVGVSLSIPQTSGTSNKIPVEAYDYDNSSRLADAYDPRITPALKTAYTYTSANRLATLTPPGQAAYSFSYDSKNRLTQISRPDPSGSTATTTIVYDVPTTGTNAPVNLSATTTGTWGEVGDLPVTGTAVFDPDHNPAGTTANAVTASDWPYADIDYLDVNSQSVNTASYGAGAWQTTTSQYDTNGNDIWDLTAGNRNQAINTSPDPNTDPYVENYPAGAARAVLLTSQTVYDPLNAGQVTDTFGPTHPVTLSSGAVIDARTHEATNYDEGAPNADVNPATSQPYSLPTTVTTTAYRPDNQTDSSWPDQSIGHMGYDPVVSGDSSGWDLGQATSSTTQMGANPTSADLVTYTRYDANGRTFEQRQPGDASGTGPRTTDATYYAATGAGSCVNPSQAGLVCSSAPAGQPATGDPLPVTTYNYDAYSNPTTTTQAYGTGDGQVVRTRTTIYDAAERAVSSSVTVSPASAGGNVLPAVTYAYDPDMGLPTTASTTNGGTPTTLTAGYDDLGQTTSYTDATGNKSTTTYDLAGNVTSTNDGKSTTTYTINGTGTGEHRGMVTSENIGITGSPSTFTATYDGDGNLTSEIYPNGLVATTSYDNVDQTTDLSYAMNGTKWLDFKQAANSQGQVVKQTSPESAQTFTYDGSDRLTRVQDTDNPAGGSGNTCTTRDYSFDPDSNRTSLNAYPASANGTCTTNSFPNTTNYSYDQADRLTSDTAGAYSYDALGRAMSIPAGDASGIGVHSGIGGNVAVAYYANDMVQSETQGSTSDTFTLDPGQNRIATETDGGTTSTDHYSGDRDSPTWTATGSSWTEYVSGIDRGLAVAVTNTSVELLLVDPRGDIEATMPDSTTATSTDTYSETTEYGAPRNVNTAYMRYGWLGSERRSTDNLGGLVTMGVRLYSPGTGRFISTDRISGGNANSYNYPSDPVNNSDTTGESECHSKEHTVNGGGGSFYLSISIHFCRDGTRIWDTSASYHWKTDGCFDFGIGGCWSHWFDRYSHDQYTGKVRGGYGAWWITAEAGWTGEASNSYGSFRTDLLCVGYAVFANGGAYLETGHHYGYGIFTGSSACED